MKCLANQYLLSYLSHVEWKACPTDTHDLSGIVPIYLGHQLRFISHQWRVHPHDCSELSLVLDRGQELFNVAVPVCSDKYISYTTRCYILLVSW